MVARRFLVRFHDAYFDVDYDTDHGLELFKDLVWSLTSIPPEKQKIFGSDDDRLVLDDSDLASISDRLRVASIADEVEQGEKSVDQNANLARFDEDLARMLQAEEEEEVEALMRNEKEKAEALMLQQFDQVKGKISGEEGWISLGPWGELRRGEEYWDYKPNGPLMQITISYSNGCAIDSVLFESKGYNGVVIGSSVKVGGTAGDGRWTKTFCINRSVEQLSSISLTYELNDRYPGGAVMSLCFETNRGNKYGPFGGSMGNYSLSIPIQGGVITGFHGRAGAGSWLYAIGIFVAPSVNSSGKKVGSLHSIQNPDSAPTQLKDKIRDGERCISLGPWGGNDGEDWAYKTNGPIMQISICFGQAIDSILFESKSYDGVLIGSSKKIGGSGGHATEMFCIDTSEEQLSAISLTYEYFSGKVTIISLCICTNINKYGPFGLRSGPSSLSIPIEGGVLTGFHGRAGTHLYAIGILVAPKVNGLHPIQDPNSMPTQFKVFGSGVGSKLKTPDDQKLKTPDNTIIHSAASSCGTTKEDDHHGGAPSSSSEMIRMNLDLVDSAFQKYKIHMDMQISEAREKFKELQKLGSSERDFDELGQVIAKLKFQIPLISNKDDHHGEALSPTSKMIRSDLILVDTAFAEAKESLYHMNVKINEAHDKFKDLQLLPSTERDSDKLRKADMTNYERTSQS